MVTVEDNKMEVDMTPIPNEEEGEEGEITDQNDEEMDFQQMSDPKNIPNKPRMDATGIFATVLFGQDEQQKLEERAKRFALKPEEVKNFTENDLQQLYKSLGINPQNEDEVKFNVLHLYGVENMHVEDILNMFEKYVPDSIEYIENNTCNVVWLENLSAARALHYTSKPVNGMPARGAADIFSKEFLDEPFENVIEEETGQSILLKDSNREVELRQDDDVIIRPSKICMKDGVDIGEIKITIPPGYWRLSSNPKAENLLIRFGLVSDKVCYRSESLSKYYKNPTIKSVIPQNKRKEIRSIFERNKALQDKSNPWGSIAKDWDKDSRNREKSPVMLDDVIIVEELSTPIIRNPKILARLGKRKVDDDIEFVEKVVDEKKTKMPRMKMYADEEEERLKRKKILQKIKAQSQKIEEGNNKPDLRNMLGRTGNVKIPEKNIQQVTEIDLGSKLNNRTQKMVFTIERDNKKELPEKNTVPAREILQDDIRSLLLQRRNDRERRIKIEKRVTPPRKRVQIFAEEPHKSRKDYTSGIDNSEKSHSSKRLYSDRLNKDREKHNKSSKYHRNTSYEKRDHKTRSRVVVGQRTPKKPTVASTVWSKVKKSSGSSEESSTDSDSDSDSESENSSSSSSSSESESDSGSDESSSSSSSGSRKQSKHTSSSKNINSKKISRPGFEEISHVKQRLSHSKVTGRLPLKITTNNTRN